MNAPQEPMRFGSGHAVRRIEDPALVRGQGRFTDDVNPPGQAFAAFVRSPLAHARIGAIDSAAVLAMPGVLAVHTGAELVAAGVLPMPMAPALKRPDGRPMTAAPRRALAHERARCVGEAVALVVAGWDWAQRVQRRAPRHVEQWRHGVALRHQGRLQRAAPGQPAVHVTRHEAQAWCAWAGRRLPTEPEWELAACAGRTRGFVWRMGGPNATSMAGGRPGRSTGWGARAWRPPTPPAPSAPPPSEGVALRRDGGRRSTCLRSIRIGASLEAPANGDDGCIRRCCWRWRWPVRPAKQAPPPT